MKAIKLALLLVLTVSLPAVVIQNTNPVHVRFCGLKGRCRQSFSCC